ncbi:WD40 repeat-like protein [Saitoella complicata NRRL Y-17804]|uniref:WD40 repeat-like protein n=1 Tax=Saitoella complicata (strain BCRC 22490 / CBS 7301 / JCM 7358 / NBRC 10748 / NRRL Y-17804) TaxID=698492 RepID=UPI0008669B2E|nr:WD40 repeat-like protein [Saitoella complicata NRRL Y-17804]ODQ54514.1 WD40 repeat-like protein [Saitoella complicata NRRL Y-17804]
MSKRPASKTSGTITKKAKLAPLLPSVPSSTSTAAFRVIAGSYEHVLYGLDAMFDSAAGKGSDAHMEPVFIFPAHMAAMKTLAVGGRYLASGGADEIIKLYDLKLRKDLGTLHAHNGSITHLSFPTKQHLLSSDSTGTIVVWRTKDWENMATMKQKSSVQGGKKGITSFAAHPSGKIALSVGEDRRVTLWNLMTARRAAVNKLPLQPTKLGDPLSVAWSPSGDRYAVMFDRHLVVYGTATQTVVGGAQCVSKMHCFAWLDEERVVIGHEDTKIRVWNPIAPPETEDVERHRGIEIQAWTGHRARVKCIERAPTPNTNIFVTASSDGEIKLWRVGSELTGEENKGGEEVEETKEIGSFECGNRITCLTVADVGHVEKLKEEVVKTEVESDGEGEGDEDFPVSEAGEFPFCAGRSSPDDVEGREASVGECQDEMIAMTARSKAGAAKDLSSGEQESDVVSHEVTKDEADAGDSEGEIVGPTSIDFSDTPLSSD